MIDRLAIDPEVSDAIAFHAQQSIEKSLKAFLAIHGQPIPRTHNLDVLVSLCVVLNPEFERLRVRSTPMTRFAIVGRYPDDSEDVSAEEAELAPQWSHEVFLVVLGHMAQTDPQ